MNFNLYAALIAIFFSPTAAYEFDDLKACIAMGFNLARD